MHSHSSVATFMRCPREYKHKYVDRRVADESDERMDFGKQFHEHLQHGTAPDIVAYDYGSARLQALLTGYRKTYSNDDGVEREIEWTVGDERGVWDGLGYKYLIEDKTTSSSIGEYYWQRKVLDDQTSLYLWAARELNYNITYMKYRVTRVPSMKPKAREPIADYYNRYYDHVYDYREGIFVEQLVYRSDAELEAFSTSRTQAKQLIAHCTNTGAFPRNTGSCFAFNRSCMYLPVCSGSTTIDDNRLYHIRTR